MKLVCFVSFKSAIYLNDDNNNKKNYEIKIIFWLKVLKGTVKMNCTLCSCLTYYVFNIILGQIYFY